MHCESKENKKQYLRARILLNGQQPNMYTKNSHYTYDHLKFYFMLFVSVFAVSYVSYFRNKPNIASYFVPTIFYRRNIKMSIVNKNSQMISNIPCGIVARICGFHPQGPGLIPGMGKRRLCFFY
ncbi:hypothetical protein T12_10471 [Trichinella patagoniensis]|uniref:Transmembrane protein n=1 Tax=Trichinella patagoniensis TaxID=990121 RepID=A0A0V0ZGN1_9BILA|nr:hypothetical protein T12_10471 [Trichinella patagoniensis]